MAIGLSEDLNKLLKVKTGGLAGKSVNPHNLEKLSFHDGFEMQDIEQLLNLSEEQTDKLIDKNVELTEQRYNATRALESYSKLIDAEQKLINKMAEVQKKLAKLEISREEAFSQWKTLKHQLGVARRQSAFQHAADVEASNVGFANFQRGYQQKLHNATNVSLSEGTHRGSSILANRVPVAVLN